jgi:hypothetical protein
MLLRAFASREKRMAEDTTSESPKELRVKRLRTPLPAGYRQGIITAITVLLGFSLLFVRYWNFELSGAWSISSVTADILMALAIVLQVIALWRSLQVKDDDEIEYGITLRWFLASAIVLLIGLTISGLSFSHVIKF